MVTGAKHGIYLYIHILLLFKDLWTESGNELNSKQDLRGMRKHRKESQQVQMVLLQYFI